MAEIDRDKRKINSRVDEHFNKSYHDVTRNQFVMDMFKRPWGTEFMVHVWWAGWDDIIVETFDGGFLVDIDLGSERDVETEPNSYLKVGGRWYLYYYFRGLSLPDPELGLDKNVFHLHFADVDLPMDESSRGSIKSDMLPRTEVISEIKNGFRGLHERLQ
jgi:hypothetical protein